MQRARPPNVSPGDDTVARDARPRPALLYVATVSATVAQFLTPYATHYRAMGWRVDAATGHDRWDSAVEDAFDRRHDIPWSRSVRDAGRLPRAASSLLSIMENGYDIVHVHTPIAAFVTRAALRRMDPARRPAIVYTAHGFHFHAGGAALANAVFLGLEKIAGRWTDRLIVINEEDERAARRHHLVPPDRLVRMPGIGIDTGVYAPSALPADAVAVARSSAGIPLDVPLFVVVGELNIGKRPHDVVRALGRLRHQDAHVAFLGQGPERDHLLRVARRAGVLNRVRFPGFVPDPRPFEAGSTAVILASSREGLARSVMEGLALEIPVIASTARGNAELVGEVGGFVLQIGDIGTLASRMDWLIEHPVDRIEMGRRGRQRMIARYELRHLLNLHDGLYEEILAARPAASPDS